MASSTENKSLQEHLDTLAMTPGLFAHHAHLNTPVVERALKGLEISRPDAEMICRGLNRAHAIALTAVGYQPEDLPGLKVYSPPERHHAPKDESVR